MYDDLHVLWNLYTNNHLDQTKFNDLLPLTIDGVLIQNSIKNNYLFYKFLLRTLFLTW